MWTYLDNHDVGHIVFKLCKVGRYVAMLNHNHRFDSCVQWVSDLQYSIRTIILSTSVLEGPLTILTDVDGFCAFLLLDLCCLGNIGNDVQVVLPPP